MSNQDVESADEADRVDVVVAVKYYWSIC